MDDERQKDARAAALLGWHRNGEWWHTRSRQYRFKSPFDERAGRALVAALPPEARARFADALLRRVAPGAQAYHSAIECDNYGPDARDGHEVVCAIAAASPSAIRDACLEAMEHNDGR